jgi:hypothetical protein
VKKEKQNMNSFPVEQEKQVLRLSKKDQPSVDGGCKPVIPVLHRLKQEHPKFKASLGYIGRTCLKKGTKTRNRWLMFVILCSLEG